MGSRDQDYELLEPVGRVVKGGEEFADRSMRAANVDPPRRSRSNPSVFASAACAAQGFTLARLRSRSQRRPESRARIIAAYLGRRDHGVPATALAACFGRDESALAHGLRLFEEALGRDPALARHVERVATAIKAEFSTR
jgi:chromosomal replication initiation ATPase DnaA